MTIRRFSASRHCCTQHDSFQKVVVHENRLLRPHLRRQRRHDSGRAGGRRAAVCRAPGRAEPARAAGIRAGRVARDARRVLGYEDRCPHGRHRSRARPGRDQPDHLSQPAAGPHSRTRPARLSAHGRGGGGHPRRARRDDPLSRAGRGRHDRGCDRRARWRWKAWGLVAWFPRRCRWAAGWRAAHTAPCRCRPPRR